MIRLMNDEKWSVLRDHKSAYGEKCAISNCGRLVKFGREIAEGRLLKCSLQEGYPIWRFKTNGKQQHALLHRLVAKYFLPRPQKNETVVIHSNYKKNDNGLYSNVASRSIQY